MGGWVYYKEAMSLEEVRCLPWKRPFKSYGASPCLLASAALVGAQSYQLAFLTHSLLLIYSLIHSFVQHTVSGKAEKWGRVVGTQPWTQPPCTYGLVGLCDGVTAGNAGTVGANSQRNRQEAEA